MDSDFGWSRVNPNFDNNDLTGIKLNIQYDVNIGGCNFKSNINSPVCPRYRGVGIDAGSASLTVTSSGNVIVRDAYNCPTNGSMLTNPPSPGPGCEFTDLYQGIYFHPTVYTYPFSMVVSHSNFTDNLIGIEMYNTENSKILNCDFTGSRSNLNSNFTISSCGPGNPTYSSTTTVKDIIFDNSVAYEVHDCDFTFDGKHMHHITASSQNFAKCRIQMNRFNNPDINTVAADDVFGIHVDGSNNFLEIYCNTFTNMGTDINIPFSSSIINQLGSAIDPADNIFSDVKSGRFRINNASTSPIDYFIPVGGPASKNPMGYPTSDGVTVYNASGERTCSLQCEDFYTGIIDQRLEQYFNIYPNPANEIVNISSSLNVTLENCKIINSVGKVVYSYTNEPQLKSMQLNIQELSSGIYFLVIETGNNLTLNFKIIVN